MQDFEIRMRVAENIRTLRKQKKYTQFQLAEKSNLSEATIKSIELAHSYPEEKTLSQITEALEIDVVKLFMPVGESFRKNKEIAAQLKSAIAGDVRNYVDEVLREFD
jgi:transcriptional regulator with XRE-family HTH domain